MTGRVDVSSSPRLPAPTERAYQKSLLPWREKVRMRGSTFITLTSILSHQGRGGIKSHVGLWLFAFLSVALVVSCSSEPAPEPAPVPTATSVALVAPTATPVAPSAGRSSERSMAPNFSLPSAGGNDVSLSSLLDDHKAVVLVFYRGYF